VLVLWDIKFDQLNIVFNLDFYLLVNTLYLHYEDQSAMLGS